MFERVQDHFMVSRSVTLLANVWHDCVDYGIKSESPLKILILPHNMILCYPAVFYFLLGIFGLGRSTCIDTMNSTSLAFIGLYVLIGAGLLNYLCSKGYAMVSWILFPVFLLVGDATLPKLLQL